MMILCTSLLGLNAVSVFAFEMQFSDRPNLLKTLQALFVGLFDSIRLFIDLLITMIYISVLCMFGDRTASHFEGIHNMMCMQLRWNEFPLGIQKYFPMMLLVMTKPVYVQGYMAVNCTREFMKRVSLSFL